jgi:hypothetical protein
LDEKKSRIVVASWIMALAMASMVLGFMRQNLLFEMGNWEKRMKGLKLEIWMKISA